MDLRDYFRTIAKRWRVIVACTVLGVALAAAVTVTETPQYQANSQLFVSVQSGTGDASAANQGNSFAQQRVTSYAAIVNSPLVLDDVVDDLDLTDAVAGTLGSNVSASVPLDTNLLNVSVIDTDPERAAEIANAVSERFAEVISDLERPDSEGASLVGVTVVRDAAVPGAPFSPKPRLNIAIGLLLGLALGVGVAVLRETLDRSVKSEDDLDAVSSQIGRPLNVIGTIIKDPKASKVPLIINADPQSKRAEAFRQLRTNLQFVDVDNPPRSIVITSSLAGEGKSTTSANLAIALAQAGLRVCLVEADLRRPKLADYMGIESAVGLTDVLVGRAKAADLMQPWGNLPLNFLASGRPAPNPSELLGSRTMLNLLQELEQQCDIVLLDAPPLLPVTDAAVMSALAGGALLVVRVGSTTRDQVEEAAEALQSVDARLLGVVMNMSPSRKRSGYEYKYAYPSNDDRRSGERRTTRTPASTGAIDAGPRQVTASGGRKNSRGRRP